MQEIMRSEDRETHQITEITRQIKKALEIKK